MSKRGGFEEFCCAVVLAIMSYWASPHWVGLVMAAVAGMMLMEALYRRDAR